MSTSALDFDVNPGDSQKQDAVTAEIHGRTRPLRNSAAAARQVARLLFKSRRVGKTSVSELCSHVFNTTATRVAPERLLTRIQNIENLLHLLAGVYKPQGAIAECGVYRGASALALLTFLRDHIPEFTGESVYLFDSFEGFEAYDPADIYTAHNSVGEKWSRVGKMGFKDGMEGDVRRALSEFPDVSIRPGFFSNTLQDIGEEIRFSFVHIDVDLYLATAECLEFFHSKILPGGVIVCDDYRDTSFPGAKRAWDEFMEKHQLDYMVLPSSQVVWCNT